MLYFLSNNLILRALCSFIGAFFISLIFGNVFIAFAKKFFRSKVRSQTPQSHQKKNDTPTMGGILIFLVSLISIFLFSDLTKIESWLIIFCMAGFGLIGFLDDWNKIKQQKGISKKFKFNMQLAVASITVAAWYFLLHPDTSLGILIIPWGIYILIAVSNAVNLTDGLDGLVSGPLIFNFIFFSIAAFLANDIIFSEQLKISNVNCIETVVISAILAGAVCGFLWFNTSPAIIFMGDVGALMLGGALGLIALMIRQEFMLLIVGAVFVIETLSVMIQIVSYNLFNKRRVFRMAPIHHHFELGGLAEQKIAARFRIITVVLAVVGLIVLLIRVS